MKQIYGPSMEKKNKGDFENFEISLIHHVLSPLKSYFCIKQFLIRHIIWNLIYFNSASYVVWIILYVPTNIRDKLTIE